MIAATAPEVAALAALSTLHGMGPARVRRLLDAHGDAVGAWEAIRSGRVSPDLVGGKIDERPALAARWRDEASRTTPDEVVGSVATVDMEIVHPGHAAWPAALLTDPEPPFVLFARGDLQATQAPLVAVVGTRRCTSAGTSIARELGRDLAAAGVGVVSGLALGIDGAAHRGALEANGRPVGVVATGLDVVYPRRHRDLWEDVGRRGLLLSEAPPGTGPERWRFPARNRIMAAVAEIVVVVESNATGGSMLTVDSAIERDTQVMAVPGSPRVPVSAGPNHLLADGCAVVRDATDVLVALGTSVPTAAANRGETAETDADPVADVISFPPIGLDRVVSLTRLPLPTVTARLARLEAAGTIERVGEGYQRRVR